MSIATKHGYRNIVKRLLLAEASNATEALSTAHSTQEDTNVDSTMEGRNIENASAVTSTSRYQDLQPSTGSSSEVGSRACEHGVHRYRCVQNV